MDFIKMVRGPGGRSRYVLDVTALAPVMAPVMAPALALEPNLQPVDHRVRTVHAADTLQPTDRVVFLDAAAGDFTFTLTDAVLRPGRPLTLIRKNTAGGTPSVACTGGTVCGLLTLDLLVRGQSVNLLADGVEDWSEY